MIRSLIAVTRYTPDSDTPGGRPWLAIGPARVDDVLVGVSIRLGRRAVMVDLPRRVELALDLSRPCCCCPHAEAGEDDD